MKYVNIPATIELLEQEDKLDGAFASISLNPLFQWAKIVVTDDQPNGNKMRVPQEEFSNVISTGINAPIKMAQGKLSDGHEDAFGNPIGTISQLTVEGNKVIALAALWKRERPDDISMLKEMYLNGNPPNVSWELGFERAEIEDGIQNLRGVILNGLAIVNLPAYKGRTPFIAMSSQNKNNSEDDVEELEQLKQENVELKNRITDLENAISSKDQEVASLNEELTPLRQFKESADKEAADKERLSGIKSKFSEAGIEREDTYFDENRERLLSLDEANLDFVIQELVAFAGDATASANKDIKPKVPKITTKNDPDLNDPKALAQAFRDRAKTK